MLTHCLLLVCCICCVHANTLAVIVPCHAAHVKHIDRLFKSIENQTVKPEVVAISFSSLNETPTLPVSSFQVVTTTTSEHRNAAQNRNTAAAMVSADILSFFDADDEMHPERLETIHQFFTRYPEHGAFYHSYINNKYGVNDVFQDCEDALYTNIVVKDSRAVGLGINSSFVQAHPGFGNEIHHAHVSVTQDVFTRLKFREDLSAIRREDSLYGASLIAGGIGIGFSPCRLSRYN